MIHLSTRVPVPACRFDSLTRAAPTALHNYIYAKSARLDPLNFINFYSVFFFNRIKKKRQSKLYFLIFHILKILLYTNKNVKSAVIYKKAEIFTLSYLPNTKINPIFRVSIARSTRATRNSIARSRARKTRNSYTRILAYMYRAQTHYSRTKIKRLLRNIF